METEKGVAVWHSVVKGTDAFSRFLAYFAGYGLLAIAFMQIAEIFVRNALNISLPFVWEFAGYMHIGAIFLAAAYTLRIGGHVQITAFKGLNPKLFDFVSSLLGLAVSLFLTWSFAKLALGYWTSGRTSGTVSDVPLVYPFAVVVLGSALLSLQIALRVVHVAMNAKVELEHGLGATSE